MMDNRRLFFLESHNIQYAPNATNNLISFLSAYIAALEIIVWRCYLKIILLTWTEVMFFSAEK